MTVKVFEGIRQLGFSIPMGQPEKVKIAGIWARWDPERGLWVGDRNAPVWVDIVPVGMLSMSNSGEIAPTPKPSEYAGSISVPRMPDRRGLLYLSRVKSVSVKGCARLLNRSAAYVTDCLCQTVGAPQTEEQRLRAKALEEVAKQARELLDKMEREGFQAFGLSRDDLDDALRVAASSPRKGSKR